eukprot:TRINITY_DN16937_c0_g1_i1.p1 TRINITY_DN16937_c0_g1~~TRINITY_DN16937_c0_g1_i1.p1  ORF type:complete len:215 (+),score=60.66 TRINITY_DN16937_c0_g1_i1:205-849(+)
MSMDGRAGHGTLFSYPKETFEGLLPAATTHRQYGIKPKTATVPNQCVLPEYVREVFTMSALNVAKLYIAQESEPYQREDFFTVIRSLHKFLATEPAGTAHDPLADSKRLASTMARTASPKRPFDNASPSSSTMIVSVKSSLVAPVGKDVTESMNYALGYLRSHAAERLPFWFEQQDKKCKDRFRNVFRRLWCFEQGDRNAAPETPREERPRYLS